ncbi:MAG: zinc dependent phospholipase C family protein [Bacteroidota bacterium]
MRIFRLSLCLLLAACLWTAVAPSAADWGFFGHRRINRLAVFTLPPDMMVFFKKHIEYLSEHAVDPDKRRYATRHEAVRHYIDIDHWGVYPFDEVPRDWTSTLLKYSELYVVNGANDTLLVPINKNFGWPTEQQGSQPKWKADVRKRVTQNYRRLFLRDILPNYYEDEWPLNCDSLSFLQEHYGYSDCQTAFVVDRFSEYGILPYHLIRMQKTITKAFGRGDPQRLLRLLSDFGHYVGDAHVPLHTTENYNGQLTDQVGIHAFWESRIPELFADEEFDFFVGKADYIENIDDYCWDMVLTSHNYLDSVLLIEKSLSYSFPEDQQYCYEERLGRTVRTQCRDYARAYQERMRGMVERRMRESIHALGSLWYTAWVDAGQPDLTDFKALQAAALEREQKQLEEVYKKGKSLGRTHGQ